jgi:hypothetical protein
MYIFFSPFCSFFNRVHSKQVKKGKKRQKIKCIKANSEQKKLKYIYILKGIDKVIEFLLDKLSRGKQNVKKSNSEQIYIYIYIYIYLFIYLFI